MCRAGPESVPGCAAPSRTRRRRAPAAGPPPMETIAIASGRAAQLALRHGVFQFGGEQRRGIAGLEKVLALLEDHGGRGLSTGLRLGEHARAFDRIEGKIGAGLLLEFEAVPPGGEFVGPGLDRIDMT